jgi:AcrR family transcriptional regulator
VPQAATAADDEAPRLVRAGAPAEGRELRTRGQRTVRRLLDAAVDVFAARGYHTARVDDIVKAAKTSHGTFYLYFANKEDVLRALVLDVADALAAHAEALGELTPDDAGRDELRVWLTGFAEQYDRYAPVIRAWVEAEIDTHDFGELGAEVLGRFAGVLTDRIARSPHLAADPANAATVIVAMIERCSYYATVGQITASRDALVDLLASTVHASLFGPR